MKKNLEIEYKSGLDEPTYLRLMEKYDLKKKVYKQINYYFDTENKDLIENKVTLRIRQKKDQYKLTKKVTTDHGTEETHLFLTIEEALGMIKNGFDANIINLDFNVIKMGELTTYRAKTDYKNGELFLDKSTYGKSTDFEVELEVPDLNSKHVFLELLSEEGIKFKKLKSKSYRCYKKKYKTKK